MWLWFPYWSQLTTDTWQGTNWTHWQGTASVMLTRVWGRRDKNCQALQQARWRWRQSMPCVLTLNMVGFTQIYFRSPCDARQIYMGKGQLYRGFVYKQWGFNVFLWGDFLYSRSAAVRDRVSLPMKMEKTRPFFAFLFQSSHFFYCIHRSRGRAPTLQSKCSVDPCLAKVDNGGQFGDSAYKREGGGSTPAVMPVVWH